MKNTLIPTACFHSDSSAADDREAAFALVFALAFFSFALSLGVDPALLARDFPALVVVVAPALVVLASPALVVRVVPGVVERLERAVLFSVVEAGLVDDAFLVTFLVAFLVALAFV
ncbi:MAG: hypothetical protein NZM37_11295 [Sandaracinaceae bacterium]|nr:hypothetical protein [Sandaracinaceae bacterium]MDW8246478.1 hypothetical protein [Sandaracinaceae bacterium]